MATPARSGSRTLFLVGWILLLVVAALMTANHLYLAFGVHDFTVGIGYSAFNLYALVVLIIPFRRLEWWAWLTTWILPIALALPAGNLGVPELMTFYYVSAAVAVVGLLLTLSTFLAARRGARSQ